MKKFPVFTLVNGKAVKRSLTLSQIEILFLAAIDCKIQDEKKNDFTLAMTFHNGEFNKAIRVKKIPNGYKNKFKV